MWLTHPKNATFLESGVMTCGTCVSNACGKCVNIASGHYHEAIENSCDCEWWCKREPTISPSELAEMGDDILHRNDHVASPYERTEFAEAAKKVVGNRSCCNCAHRVDGDCYHEESAYYYNAIPDSPCRYWVMKYEAKKVVVEPLYAELRRILGMAYARAATGKGKERHANGEPWEQQPILTITRKVGTGYPLGQVLKKLDEASRLDCDAAINEYLDCIVYLAAVVKRMEEE